MDTEQIPASTIPVSEELADYPSEYITGTTKKRYTLDECTLSKKSIGLLFDMFASYFDNPERGDGRYYDFATVDGFEFEVDWGVFHITVERRYKRNDVSGAIEAGFEVTKVWDAVYYCSRPYQAKRINDYAKYSRQ